jgi:predicted metal-dependent HD superfamily phosphohydrolase
VQTPMLIPHLDTLSGDPWCGDVVAPDEITEVCLSRFPPEVHLKSGRIGFVTKASEPSLAQFALRHGVPAVVRTDVWSCLLEPFLDTEMSSSHAARIATQLRSSGFSPKEVHAIRRFVGPAMLALTAETWEWMHYGLMDLIRCFDTARCSAAFDRALPGHAQYLPSDPSIEAFRSWADAIGRRGALQREVRLPPVEEGPTDDDLDREWPADGHNGPATTELAELQQSLLDAWRSPGRRYHGVTHLHSLLSTLSYPRDVTLQLAAWFHDAVYDTQVHDNEEASAQWLERTSDLWTRAELATPEQVADAARLVRLTAQPLQLIASSDPLGRRFWDADFGIFGTAPSVYDAYVTDVRAEWPHVPDALFHAGRQQFLRTLSDAVEARGFFFYTPRDPFHEAMARHNLARELDQGS